MKTIPASKQSIKPKLPPLPAPKVKVKKKSINFKLIGAIFSGILLIGGIGFGVNLYLKPKVINNWVNIDQPLSTGGILKQVKTSSVAAKEIKVGTKYAINNDGLSVIIKKIDGKNSVWIKVDNSNFFCVSTFTSKCIIQATFDKNPPINFNYDGGTQQTAYLIDSDSFISKTSSSSSLLITVNTAKGFVNPDEKAGQAFENGGVHSEDYNTKEFELNVSNLIWK